MTATLAVTMSERARWCISGLVVVALHAALAASIMRVSGAGDNATGPAPFVVDLAPLAVTQINQISVEPQDRLYERPEIVERPESPAPDKPIETQVRRQEADPQPDMPRVEAPEIPMTPPMRDEPKPQPRATPQTATPEVLAASPSGARDGAVAIPAVRGSAGAAVADPAIVRWTTRALEQLARDRRYPLVAERRREEGTVIVVFAIDRNGKLLESRVSRSSGSAALDAEALAMLARASPFPTPPAAMPGAAIPLTLPIQFKIRDAAGKR